MVIIAGDWNVRQVAQCSHDELCNWQIWHRGPVRLWFLRFAKKYALFVANT